MKIDLNTRALVAFLERIHAHKGFGPEDLQTLGRHPMGPIAHPNQLESRRVTQPVLALYGACQGPWMATTNPDGMCVVRAPYGDLTFPLPIRTTDGDRYTVIIKGVVGGKPVTTVHMECLRSVDMGMDNTRLFWGTEEIRIWPDAVLVRKDGSGLLFVQGNGEGDFAIRERLLDGTEVTHAVISQEVMYWIRGLFEDNGRLAFWGDVRDEGKTAVGYVDEKAIAWTHGKSGSGEYVMVVDGALQIFKGVTQESRPLPEPNYLLASEYARLSPKHLAFPMKGKDSYVQYMVTSADYKYRRHNQDKQMPVGPGFQVLSRPRVRDGNWCHYGYLNGHVYLMELPLPVADTAADERND